MKATGATPAAVLWWMTIYGGGGGSGSGCGSGGVGGIRCGVRGSVANMGQTTILMMKVDATINLVG